MSLYAKIVAAVFTALFSAVTLLAGLFYQQAKAEHDALKASERALRWKVEQAERRLAEQEQALRALREDPAHLERTIRQRLGWARQEERVFRFKHD